MNINMLEEQVIELVAETLHLLPTQVTLDSSLKQDLGASDQEVRNILDRMEEEFDWVEIGKDVEIISPSMKVKNLVWMIE